MSALDAVLLLVATAAALGANWTPRLLTPRVVLATGTALSVLIITQLAVEGWLYHLLPVAGLIVLFGLIALRPPRGSVGRWSLQALAIMATGLAILPWLVAPAIPVLPRPTGPHLVGSHVFRWVDSSRPEMARPGERRNVIAQLWYPAAAGGGRAPPYIDGLGQLPPTVSGLPRQLMRTYGRIDVHAHGDAPIATDRSRWPLVLFSPGAEATRAFYSGMAAELASHGVAVAMLDHPYESAVTQLADGRIATNARLFSRVANDPARAQAFMAAEQGVRAGDLRFTLDQLGREPAWRDRLTLDHVTAVGHSFGGASAIQLWTHEPRVAGVVNLDGTIYGDPGSGHARTGRILVVESDDTLTTHGARYKEGVRRLTKGLRRSPETVRIPGASHFSFTDGPAFLAWPAHMALPQLFGRRSAAEVQRLAVQQIIAVAGAPSAN